MKVSDFDFHLPTEHIAQRPVKPRDAARLLHVPSGGTFSDLGVRDLPRLLRAGDIMVFNDTRVIPARLVGKRGEARVEVTLHMRVSGDTWRAFARPARKLKPRDIVDFAPGFSAEITDRGDGGEVGLRFNQADSDLMAALEAHGGMPLPPYIKREGLADEADRSDYQTLFAAKEGAVASPTAGLHFTPELVAAIDAAGIERVTVTLHVGAGTFLPVKVENVADHVMHSEWGGVTAEAAVRINRARAAGGRVVAVGTTSLRLIESATNEKGILHPFTDETDIYITPGYRFKITDMLLTNFHLPKSTLFMLVSTFAGTDRMKAAYAHAIEDGYRFYSYGDCCLLEWSEEAP